MRHARALLSCSVLAAALAGCTDPDDGDRGADEPPDTRTCTGPGCHPQPPPAPPPPTGAVAISPAGMDCTTARSPSSRKIAAVESSDEIHIYALFKCGPDDAGYLAISPDGGVTFGAPIALGITGVREMTVAPAGDYMFVAATVTDPEAHVVLLYSNDGAATWTTRPFSDPAYNASIESDHTAHEISLVLVDHQPYVSYGVGTGPGGGWVALAADRVFDPMGTLEVAVHEDLASSLTDLLLDETTGWLIHASDGQFDPTMPANPASFVAVSMDDGESFAEVYQPGPALLADWAVGAGILYGAGSGVGENGAMDSRNLLIASPASDPGTAREAVPGLPPVYYVEGPDDLFHRAIAAGSTGNAYVATRLPSSGAIQLDLYDQALESFLLPVTVAARGHSPGVTALPEDDAAAVLFTSESGGVGRVYVSVVEKPITL